MEQLHLTEQEKQEVMRLVEEGKPLPDKYRFLLFQDKKQVELVWNGKTTETTRLASPFRPLKLWMKPGKRSLQERLNNSPFLPLMSGGAR